MQKIELFILSLGRAGSRRSRDRENSIYERMAINSSSKCVSCQHLTLTHRERVFTVFCVCHASNDRLTMSSKHSESLLHPLDLLLMRDWFSHSFFFHFPRSLFFSTLFSFSPYKMSINTQNSHRALFNIYTNYFNLLISSSTCHSTEALFSGWIESIF